MQDKQERKNNEVFDEKVQRALREFFRITGEYQDSLPEDELVDDLPQENFDKFLDWCEADGGEALVNEVVACLKAMHDVTMALRMAACYASRRQASLLPPVSHSQEK